MRRDLVAGHLWRIRLSECGGEVAAVGIWLISKDIHDMRFLRVIGMQTADRATVTTITMCGAIGNLTKGLSSRYYTTSVPLDGKSLS